MGWSWGGISTGWIVSHTDRFRAASAGAMVSNHFSVFGAADLTYDVELFYIGGSPYADPSRYMGMSPIGHVMKAKTPTLLLHGMEAVRCPYPQSVEFYKGLQAAGVDPSDLGAVLAHGPALDVQDRSETAGLASALGTAARKVPVTATKGVTGNIGAASGLADLAAMMVLAEDGQVPPILNCDRPDTEAGVNLVTGGPQPLASDHILATTNAIGGQTAAAVIRVNRARCGSSGASPN